MTVRFTRSARRHRVGRQRILDVLADPVSVRELSRDVQLTKNLVLGDDRTGRAFEVVALAGPDDELLVIHAMDLLAKYREEYEEGRGDERSP